jgi:hypothetical protein
MSHLENPLLGELEPMRFILAGRLFDTTTSTVAAVTRGVRESGPHIIHEGAISERFEGVLYRTAKENFWLAEPTISKFARGKPVVEDSARELTLKEAVEWIIEENAMILDDRGFPLPEEG